MYKYLIYAAYGWLTVTGLLHFAIDVLAQYIRGQRRPSNETTLYYGLHSAFSLGHVSFGLLCLWLAWTNIELLKETPVKFLSIAVAVGWVAVALLFSEYRPPKINAFIFLALLIAAAVAAR